MMANNLNLYVPKVKKENHCYLSHITVLYDFLFPFL